MQNIRMAKKNLSDKLNNYISSERKIKRKQKQVIGSLSLRIHTIII